MQGSDRLFKLRRRTFGIVGIRRLDGKMGISVVAPIIAQAHLLKMVFVQMIMNRQQLDRRYPQPLQIGQNPFITQGFISTCIFQIGELLGKPFDMGFINNGFAPRYFRTAIFDPIESAASDHDAFRCNGGIVAFIFRPEPCHFFGGTVTWFAVNFFGIRVNQQFVGIKT